MSSPILRITDDVVVIRPEGLPLSSQIAAIAAAAGAAATTAQIDAASVLGDSYNLFDKDAVTVGGEVQYNGGAWAEPNSVVSAPIDLRRLAPGSQITISGLAPNPALDRVVGFYSDEPTAINAPEPLLISYVTIPSTDPFTMTLPTGATWMRATVRQRQPGGGPYDQVQIERGDTATAFRPFAERLIKLNGREVGPLPQKGGGTARSIGNLVLFGDSITATENVEAGQYVYGSGHIQNWPDYAVPILAPTSAHNFAFPGAAFAAYGGATDWQKLHHQLDVAFSLGLTPDCVTVALGINDLRFQPGTLGDYDSAISKGIGALDLTVPIEAARAGFYRLQEEWPDAVKFACLPLQNAMIASTAIEAWNATIARMARRYGFTVIDCYAESGVVRDFEVPDAQGRDLYDGLHPDASGQRKQGVLIASRTLARMRG